MTNFDLADAFDKVAEGFAAAAMALRIGPETPQDASRDEQLEEAIWETSTYAEQQAAEDFGQQVIAEETRPRELREAHGSAAVCPAHGIPYLHGKRNSMFCPAKSDDPAWSNERGYCTVTPKSAAAWLRQHA